MGNSDGCEDGSSRHADFNFFFYIFVVPPLSVALFTYVLYVLFNTEKTTMIAAARVHVIIALCFEVVSVYDWLLQYYVAKDKGLQAPAAANFLVWLLGALCVVSLQQVFVQRLTSVFKGTMFAVRSRYIWLWNAFHSAAILMAIVLLSFRAVYAKCRTHTQFTGFVVANDMFPRKALEWSIPRKYEFLEICAYVPAVVSCVFGNVSLAWMFTSRMFQVVSPQRRGTDSDSSLQDVIRKSEVVTLAIFLTDIVAFIAALCGHFQALQFDVILNVAFMFCLFKFGNGWYNATLRHLELPVVKLLANFASWHSVECEMSKMHTKSVSEPCAPKITPIVSV